MNNYCVFSFFSGTVGTLDRLNLALLSPNDPPTLFRLSRFLTLAFLTFAVAEGGAAAVYGGGSFQR